jgi:hypothetical protein
MTLRVSRNDSLIGLALSSALLLGCHESETPAEIADVLYEGGATDEALEALLEGVVKDDPAEAAIFTWPADGEKLLKSNPVSFCVRIGPAEGAGASVAPGDVRLGAVSEPPRWLGLLPAAAGATFFALPQTALAHGTPISGRAYFFVFSTMDDTAVLRVFSMSPDYLPDAEALMRLHAVTDKIKVEVTNAIFEENRIPADAGPFKGVPITVQFVDSLE